MFKKLLISTMVLTKMAFGFDSLDSEIEKALKVFDTPGVAIGVVVDGQILVSKGYGVRDLEQDLPVTEETLFGLASGTKPYTSFLLGQLVDQGKLSWDDPIQKYLPHFHWQKNFKERPVTVRDILTHTSGLPRHDLLWYNASFDRSELVGKINLLEPTYPPGCKVQYNNMMFALAGEIYETITGVSWAKGLEENIFNPLKMQLATTSNDSLKVVEDAARPYAFVEGNWVSFPPRSLLTEPSSSMVTSITDQCKWLQLLLGQGVFNGEKLVSKETFEEMTQLQVADDSKIFQKFICEGVGLGWMVGQFDDKPTFFHHGYTEGYVSLTAIFPKHNIGIAMLCNTNSAHYHLLSVITQSILDELCPYEELSLVSEEKEQYELQKSRLPKFQTSEATDEFFASFIGEYLNPAYGKMQLVYENGHPYLLRNGFKLGLHWKSDNEFVVYSFVPALPQFVWEGEVFEKEDLEFHISFETSAKPIVFTKQ